MHTFDIPSKNLNSDIFFADTGWNLFVLDGKLCITGDCTREEAQAALDNHNPPAPKEPTVAEKLASVGLSLEELKAALGGN
jgi:hypothetical protein